MIRRRVNTGLGRAGGVAAVILSLAAMAGPARAQDAGTRSIFTLGAGSRGISMGRAFVSLADDASAVYWNPGALKNVGSTQFMAMYMPLYGDFTGADYTYFGFVYPTLSAGVFGVGYTRVGTTFDRYDEDSRPLGEGDYSESQLMFAYAFERHFGWLFGTLATGASFKINRQTVDPFDSTAPGVDLGFRYIPDAARSLYLGVNFQDLVGGQQKLDVADDEADRTLMLGMGVLKRFENGSALRLMIEYDSPQRADAAFHAGAEYAFSRFIALRAGFDDDTATFGLGVGAFDYGLDYAFYSRDESGMNQAVTFTANIGKSLEEKREDLAAERAREEQLVIRRAFEARVTEHRNKARELEATGDLAGALTEWRIVLEFVPDDAQAQGSAAAVREQLLQQQAAATRDVENQAIIRTRFALGLDLFDQNDLVGARAEWRAILEIDPAHEGAKEYLTRTQDRIDTAVAGHVTRANRLEGENRLTEAIAEWNNVQQYDPESARARGAVARIRGKIESMSQDYTATQRRLRIVTLYNDALQMYNGGDYPGAMKNLNELLALQPDHADARKLQALAKRRTTPLTDQEKTRIRELYLQGMQHFSKDEYAQAITAWEQILQIDPTNESVQRSVDEARDRMRKVQERR